MQRPVQSILIAEDRSEDVLLFREALKRAGIQAKVFFVSNGEELISYLLRKGKYANREIYFLPELIILDLKMPRVGGLQALEIMQTRPEIKMLPKIVLSSSSLDEEITCAYTRGANTYFVKPSTLEELVQILTTIKLYWEKAGRVILH